MICYFNKQGYIEMALGHKAASIWQRSDLRVLASTSTMENGSKWVHVSASKPREHPSWEDIVLVKESFIGKESAAILVLPPRSEHVNVMAHCFHWWAHISGPKDFPNLHKITWETALET